MELRELLLAVNEQGLTKTRLEELYDHFLTLFSATELRIGEIEKEEALFMERLREDTVASNNRSWKATNLGQELITLKRESKVIEKYMSSVRHKIFSSY